MAGVRLEVFVAMVERGQHGDAVGRVLVRLGLVVVVERHVVCRVVDERDAAAAAVARQLIARGSGGRHRRLVSLLVRVLVEQEDLLPLGRLTIGVRGRRWRLSVVSVARYGQAEIYSLYIIECVHILLLNKFYKLTYTIILSLEFATD